jgi:hypothetical protein
MIAYVGCEAEALPVIFRAFKEGSQCDPYVKDALGPAYTCHPHGWGLALYDGAGLHHVRSSQPVWEENFAFPALKGNRIYALFHSRLASNPKLSSPICSHPFMVSTEKEILLLAHNGVVEVDEPPTPRVVDSEWALGEIARAGGIAQALPKLKERTKPKSALNLMIMAIPRDETAPAAIHCLNFFKSEEPGRVQYYKMRTADFGGGRVFFSSTFSGMEGLGNVETAPFGEVFVL